MALQACPVSRLGRGLVGLANSAETAEQTNLVGMANEINLASGDGWALLAPYGDWPHAAGIQRFHKPEAEEMVKYFRNTWNRIKRAFVGTAIFRGHPDVPALANEYPDKTTYGTVGDIEARDDGMYFRPTLTPAGADQVEKHGAKFVSPHWLANELPAENGRRIYRPLMLVSVGLTPTPNIPGRALTNSASDSAPDSSDMNLLTKLIQLLSLANEATEDQVVAKVTDLAARPEATALANEQSKATALDAQLAEAKTALANEQTALANERAALKAARTAHAETLVNAAIAAGRITEAAKPVWLARLDRDFSAESVALANEKPALKTTAATVTLGARKPATEVANKFRSLVNERMEKHGETYEAAWQATKGTAEGKALLDQMISKAAV